MKVSDITAIALFVALIAAMGKIPALVAFSSVPISAQTLAVMLTGALLPPKQSLLSVLVFLLIVASGLPLMSSGQGGFTVFDSPATGYVLGWMPGAWCIAMIYKYLDRRLSPICEVLALALGGVVVIHICGIAWFVEYLAMPLRKACILDIAYLPGDIAKVIVAYIAAGNIRRALPQIFPRRQRN